MRDIPVKSSMRYISLLYLKGRNLKYFKLLITLVIILLQLSCVPQQRFKPIDRSESEFLNFKGLIVLKLPQGKDWYEIVNRGGITAFGKKLESKDHTFIASSHISRSNMKFNTPEEFLSFVKESRMKGTPLDKFTIINYEEILDNSRTEYCTKFILEAEEKGKGVLESHGYSCLHPKYSELAVTIEYSERTKGPKVSEQIRIEGENFINSLELRQ